MPKCKNCGRVYADWRDECPECGFHTPKQSKPITPYIAAIGIVVLVIIVFIVFGGGGCLLWGECNGEDGGRDGEFPNVTPPTPPPCQVQVGTVGIVANKLANNKIKISVMGDPKSSLVHDFTIMLNDATLNTTLGISTGSNVEIQGTGGSDTVRVVANSTCGVSLLVLNKQF